MRPHASSPNDTRLVTESPTGATDLYRSLGFRPVRTFTNWRKPL